MAAQKPTVASLAKRADETDAKLDAILSALTGSEDQAEAKPRKRASKPKPQESRENVPAWRACSPNEVVGVDGSTGKAFYVTFAVRDEKSDSPVISEKANNGRGGPARAKRITPDAAEYLLDHADEVREMIAYARSKNA